jgi:sugar O-acyltransferase (sialic acid O-acetyltransferase NeuD family)
MNKVALGLYGAGSFGREVLALLPSIISRLFPSIPSKNILIIFIDDDRTINTLDNIKVISRDEFLKLAETDKYELFYCVTIASSKIRKLIVQKMEETNSKPLTLIFSDTLILDYTRIGSGSIIMPGSKISTSVQINNHVHINFNSYVGHDSILNDFVTLSPGVVCCGNTTIGESTFLGAGSVIKQGSSIHPRLIGPESTLGIGSTLITDLPSKQTYVGNPAKKLEP